MALHDRTVADDKVGPFCEIVRYQLNFCIRGSHDLQRFQISMFPNVRWFCAAGTCMFYLVGKAHLLSILMCLTPTLFSSFAAKQHTSMILVQ